MWYFKVRPSPLSLMWHHYRGGLAMAFGIPFLGRLVYRNQKSEELGDEFIDSLIFSRHCKLIDISTTLTSGYFNIKWNGWKSSGGYDLIDILFGEHKRIGVPDKEEPTQTLWTSSDNRTFELTYGSLYQVRPRLPWLKKHIKEGWLIRECPSDREPILPPGVVFIVDSPAGVESLIQTLAGLREGIRQSADYFEGREGKPM